VDRALSRTDLLLLGFGVACLLGAVAISVTFALH